MEWPNPQQVQALLDAGGLSGAEFDVLSEFLSLPVTDWQHYVDQEVLASDEDDPEDAGYAESFPTTAMVRRVNQILQNRR